MHFAPPPDNLPVVADDLSALERERADLPGAETLFDLRQVAALELGVQRLAPSHEAVTRLRAALVVDVPEAVGFDDDAIRTMARETLEYIVALLSIASSRLDRGLPLSRTQSEPNP